MGARKGKVELHFYGIYVRQFYGNIWEKERSEGDLTGHFSQHVLHMVMYVAR